MSLFPTPPPLTKPEALFFFFVNCKVINSEKPKPNNPFCHFLQNPFLFFDSRVNGFTLRHRHRNEAVFRSLRVPRQHLQKPRCRRSLHWLSQRKWPQFEVQNRFRWHHQLPRGGFIYLSINKHPYVISSKKIIFLKEKLWWDFTFFSLTGMCNVFTRSIIQKSHCNDS